MDQLVVSFDSLAYALQSACLVAPCSPAMRPLAGWYVLECLLSLWMVWYGWMAHVLRVLANRALTRPTNHLVSSLGFLLLA